MLTSKPYMHWYKMLIIWMLETYRVQDQPISLTCIRSSGDRGHLSVCPQIFTSPFSIHLLTQKAFINSYCV